MLRSAYMLDTDPDMLEDDIDPDSLDPADEELAELENEADEDDDLDTFGEPPIPGLDDHDQFGRTRH